jgi:2-polyprenyl-3-methyl-5-hydroxy-6-metoxy-1,4-benzoquinol methylase
LDICCGTGTNPIYLAKNGFDVTGIDISLTAIVIAKESKASESQYQACVCRHQKHPQSRKGKGV